MYLKNLSIKGFKSFAKKTELEFRSGISMIVGPNGSGKSNITDAIQWVLGEQSPSSLRGSAMQDVIFAGSLGHKALGLAEVTLALDNTDKSLDLDFSEVTVTRRILRTGENSYFINSTPCRLLDVYELLHDSGLGRQTHSIIGQGRLEEVISSRPEEKRVLLEEAAGVLKHKKRKERALRKLVSTEDNLKRAKDILKEISKQIKPLEEQVGKAKTFSELNSRLKTLEIAHLVQKIEKLNKKAAALCENELQNKKKRLPLEKELKNVTEKIVSEEEKYQERAVQVLKLQDTKDRLTNLKAGLENIYKLEEHKAISAKKSILDAQEQYSTLQSQISLKQAQMQNLKRQFTKLQTDISRNLKSIALKRKESEKMLPNINDIDNMLQSRTARLDEINNEITAKESKSLEQTNNIHFCRKEVEKNEQKAQALQAEISQDAKNLSGLEGSNAELAEELIETEKEINANAVQLQSIQNKIQVSETKLSGHIRNKSHIEGQLEHLKNIQTQMQPLNWNKKSRLANISSSFLLKHLEVKKKYIKAVESYLGGLVKGLVTNNFRDAKKILEIAGEESQSITILVKDEQAQPALKSDPFTRKTPLWLKSLFKNVEIVGSIGDIPEDNKDNTYVTLNGEIYDRGIFKADYRSSKKGLLSLNDEINEKSKALERLNEEISVLNEEKEQHGEQISKVAKNIELKREALNNLKADKARIEAKIKVTEEQLYQKNQIFTDTKKAIETGKNTIDSLEAEKTVLKDRLDVLTKQKLREDKEIKNLEAKHKIISEQKQNHQLASTELNYQAKNLQQQLLSLKRQLDEVKEEHISLSKQSRKCLGKISGLENRLSFKDKFLPTVSRLREASCRLQEQLVKEEIKTGSLALIKNLREKEKALAQELKEIEFKKQELALEKNNLKENLDNLADCIINEHKLALETAIKDYSGIETSRNLISDVKQHLDKIGPVNAVAEEQFKELDKRKQFLEKQIEDLQRSKNSIHKIIRVIDKKIQEALLFAFEEISRNFKQLFGRLFPGGQAELVLTGDNIFDSGLDVKAQPYGKNLKKLSLLSGGETALTALALLFAVYHARPSPFYVLDEVEAALDDINLQRFIRLLREMKAQTQFVVITHQRRTMEIADCLYGITMQADGVSKVVSQKMAPVSNKEPRSEVNKEVSVS